MDALFFDAAKPQGAVSAGEWEDFLKRVVTPRFPEGLTWWNASGQWRNEAGVIELENSRVLQIAHPDTEELENAVREIMRAYKLEYQHKAVLRIRSTVCQSL